MTPEEIEHRLQTEPDFVNLPRQDFSLLKVLEKYPDGAPARIVAQALGLSEEELQELQEKVIKKLRKFMGLR